MEVQKWLEENYPQTSRHRHKVMYIDEQLEGELDLASFNILKSICISQHVDRNKFTIKNKKGPTVILELVNVKEYLDQNYPKEKRNEIEELNIAEKGLEGDLDLRDFVNLKELSCWNNKLTSLNVDNCLKIEKIVAYNNQIGKLVGSEKLINLKEINLINNKLTELNLTASTKLFWVAAHGNPTKTVEIGDTPHLTHYVGKDIVLSWEGIKKKELIEVAEGLGIKPEQIQNETTEKVREIIIKRVNELKNSENNQKPSGLPDDWQDQLNSITELKNKIQQAEKFGLTDWENLAIQTQNETLTSLLGRPKRSELEEVEKERDNRPNITNETWNDYKDRPTLDQYNSRPDTTIEDYDNNKSELDKANKKVQDYENGLKDKLKLTNDTLPNWRDEIDKLKNRPTSDNFDQIKNDLDTAQKSLKEWEDRFGDKTAEQVKQENEKAKTVDDLQKELDDLKSKATDATLINEKQQKIDELIKIIERLNEAVKKYGKELHGHTGDKSWQNVIVVDVSKLKN